MKAYSLTLTQDEARVLSCVAGLGLAQAAGDRQRASVLATYALYNSLRYPDAMLSLSESVALLAERIAADTKVAL